MKRTAALVFIFCAVAAAAPAKKAASLFVVERNKNANVIHYDANLLADGVIDDDEPVSAYWIMLAEDGRREDLNLAERTLAYGFNIKADKSKTFYRMTLAAKKDREIIVRVVDGKVRAEIIIGGKPSIFEKMYVHATEGWVRTTVNYIELFGRDLATGEPRYEKILAD